MITGELFQQILSHAYRSHKEELSRDSFVSKLKRELDESQQKLSTVEEVQYVDL